jgi:hypothetical protein
VAVVLLAKRSVYARRLPGRVFTVSSQIFPLNLVESTTSGIGLRFSVCLFEITPRNDSCAEKIRCSEPPGHRLESSITCSAGVELRQTGECGFRAISQIKEIGVWVGKVYEAAPTLLSPKG